MPEEETIEFETSVDEQKDAEAIFGCENNPLQYAVFPNGKIVLD